MDMDLMGMVSSTTVTTYPYTGNQTFEGMVIHMGSVFGRPAGNQAGYQQIFDAVLASLQFSMIPESALLPDIDPNACISSEDVTFGLTEDDPIVLYHYPGYDQERLDAYLELFAGPEGQPVTQVPDDGEIGMVDELTTAGFDTTGIQRILVTYAGLAEPVKLYITMLEPGLEDDLTQPPVPTGFMCQEP
jgi:hypothetical protein